MCAKFGCGPTVVSNKKGGTDRQTDKGKLQLYIVDRNIWSRQSPIFMLSIQCCILSILFHSFYMICDADVICKFQICSDSKEITLT